MNSSLRSDANTIIERSIQAVLPDEAVRRALSGRAFSGRVLLVAAGNGSAVQPGHAKRPKLHGWGEGMCNKIKARALASGNIPVV